MNLPSPPHGLGDVLRWARDLYYYLMERDDTRSHDTLLHRTTKGTFRSALAGDENGGGGTLSLKGHWDRYKAYSEGDIIYDDAFYEDGIWQGFVIEDDATRAGLYVCTTDVAAIDPDVDPGGNPYPSQDHGHWEMYARGYWEKMTMRKGNQLLVMDVGRDDAQLPYFEITEDYLDGTSRSVKIRIADMPTGTGASEIIIREDYFCVGLGTKRALWARSEFYD